MTVGPTSERTQRLVRGLRWLELGRSASAAWGRCQGSAAAPYQTVVAADRPTITSCSCPSRQRPCKHARGLAELAADGQLAAADEPAWVTGQLARPPFAEPAGDRAPTDRPGPDLEAAARRAEARREKVTAGLAELQIWLGDQIRSGLADLPRAGYAHVDAIAARMVDAQAPGVAGPLRSLPADLVSADWPGRVLHTLGGLQLLAEAHVRLDELPDELAATVRGRVGYQVTKETVRTRPAVRDRWWAIAAVDTVEFQLTSRRVWLRGLDSGRWARWLTFAPPGRDLDTTIRPGRVYECDARFYPGSGQRVLLEPPLPDPDVPVEDSGALDGAAPDAETSGRAWDGDDLAAVRGQLADLLAADPWASRLPVVVAGVPVPPRHPGEDWTLRDATGATIPLVDLDGDPWPLVAQSGGEPIPVMGEFDGHGLLALAILSDTRGHRYSTVVTG